MDKEEFKTMFKECFSLVVCTGWNEKCSEWCLKISLVDNDTGEIVVKDEIPTYIIKE